MSDVGRPPPRIFTFVSIPRLEVVELAVAAGFNGVLVDLEHGPITVSDLPPLAAAAESKRGACLVRVDSVTSAATGRALDCGATGIVFPHVGDADSAALAAGRARFDGRRSLNPFVRAAGYGQRRDYPESADRNVEVICTIESRDGLDNVEHILRVDGVSGLFVGPYDLSVALGHPGDTHHPIVIDAIDHVIRLATAVGKSIGVFSSTARDAMGWRAKGVDTTFIGVDVDIYRSACLGILSDLETTNSPVEESA